MANSGKIPFFFIIGRPRSGSTLLRTMFDAHPNVCIPFECPMIINLYLKYGKVKSWTKKLKDDFYEDLFKQWKFDSFRANNEELKADIINLPEESDFEDFIRVVYKNFNSIFEKEEILFFGDKNPEYSLNAFYISRLIKIFPQAKFIYLVRDYRDNFVSYKNVDFEAPVVSLISYRWKKSVISIEKFKKKYPEKFTSIRFEDLLCEPEKNLKTLCAFLNLNFSPEMLNYNRKKQEFMDAFPKDVLEKYHSSTMGEINKGKIDNWKENLTESQIRKADFVAGKTAERFGYIRNYKKTSIKTFFSASPWIVYGRFWLVLKWIVDHLPFSWRTAIIAKGPVLAWLYLKLSKSKK